MWALKASMASSLNDVRFMPLCSCKLVERTSSSSYRARQ